MSSPNPTDSLSPPENAIWAIQPPSPLEIDPENDKENIRPTKCATSKVKPSSCVFVASLKATDSDDNLCRSVTNHFSQFGPLVSVKVLRDPANRPYAFVQYTNDDDCRSAIELGHNSILSGRRLRCEAAKVNRTLFLAGLEPMDLSTVEHKMSQFGETELIIASSGNGQLISDSLPVATSSLNWFIKYCYRDDAIRAFASITDDPDFNVEWAQNIDDLNAGVPRIDKLSIYVGQLASEATESDLRDHFSVNGEIDEISIKSKANSTFAFITFRLEEAAASAVARENHSMFMNKTIHVQYKEFTSRNTTRIILSPRTPIALAPPPINVRRRQVPVDVAYGSQSSSGSWSRSSDSTRNFVAGYAYHGSHGEYESPRNYKAEKIVPRRRVFGPKDQSNKPTDVRFASHSSRSNRQFVSKLGKNRASEEYNARDYVRQMDSSHTGSLIGAYKPPFKFKEKNQQTD